MKILSKILTPQKKSSQLWLSFLGLSFGLISSLLSLTLIVDITQAGQTDDDIFGENTLIIQKHVSRMTSLGMNQTGFTTEDLAYIKDQPFILEVAPFKTANYEVGISENPGDGLPSFYAEMFLQSVPNDFLEDIDTSVWYWHNEDDIVPIILPRDFLTLVNYGIGPSKGLPQISEELIKSVRLRLHLSGSQKKGVVLGRVVGFSSKISSVLVPESFIDLSNDIYSNRQAVVPNRLFIRTEANAYSDVNDLMSELNLDIAESELSLSKIRTYLIQMVTLFFIFAMIILGLSVMYFVQYAQMILYRLKDEVHLLIKLGYQPRTVIRSLQRQFLTMLIGLLVFAFLLVFLVKLLAINPLLLNLGINVSFIGFFFGILFVILLLLGCTILLRKVLLKTILKIFKMG